jgi:5-methylcytosine-specific restriction endonuclease McrA
MPLTREQRALYGPNWRDVSRAVRAASSWTCQRCGAQHGAPIAHSTQQELALDDARVRQRGALRNRVILTVAHLDHVCTNHDRSNLAVLCQRCHLAHDRLDNLARRRRTRAAQQIQLCLAIA